MVGEVRLTDTEQALDAGLQLVIHPDTTHCVVDSGENHHRVLVRVLIDNLLVHLEEVAVLLGYYILTQALDGLREIEEHRQARVVDAIALVATLLGGTRCHITGNEVTKRRVTALQIVVAVFFGDVTTLDFATLQFLCVFEFLRHPDTAIVTQRLGHQRQFRLEIAVLGDTSRVNLCVAGVSEICAVAVHLHSGRTVGCHGVGREEEGVAVTTRSDDDCVGKKALDTTRNQVTSDDTARTLLAVLVLNHDDVEHLVAVVHLDLALTDLAAQC